MGAVSDDNATRKRDGKVDVQELLEFIFPKSLQHPLSTGRLYAFALYGPLDSNSELRSGYNGQRVVSTWEIDTMCLQFEREDILQVCNVGMIAGCQTHGFGFFMEYNSSTLRCVCRNDLAIKLCA